MPNNAATFLHDIMKLAISRFIPSRMIQKFISTTDWLDESCLKLVHNKNKVFGTDQYQEMNTKCSRGLLNAYINHAEHMKEKLMSLKRESKRW